MSSVRPVRFLSLFSGIEAASAAWLPLGWQCVAVAELDKFPSRVLTHHHPDVPNLGDVTKITDDQVRALGHIDVVVFGSPCQDLSVAGKRAGLAGKRSGLFYDAMRIVRVSGARFALWENVPGAFSSNKGADFAAVLAELSGLDHATPPKGWGNEGAIVGPEAMVEWSTLDAQWFGVAQRRRRVFALADFGDWFNRPAVLLEPESLRGNSAPSREAGQTAPTIPSRRTAGGGLGTDFDCDGGLIAKSLLAKGNSSHDATLETYVTHSLRAEGFDASEDGTGRGTPLVPVVCPTLRAGGNKTGGDRPPGTDVDTADSLVVVHGTQDPCTDNDIAFALGRNNGQENAVCFDETQITSKANRSNPQPGDPCHTLAAAAAAAARPPVLAFSCKDHGADVGEVSPTLRSMGHDGSHANAGGQVAVAFAIQAGALRENPNSGPDGVGVQADHAYTLEARAEVQAVAIAVALRGREGGGTAELGDEVGHTLRAASGGGDKAHILTQMQVRRLTPRECERLQGFNDDHTLVPVGKGTAKDGPRYKALGNSMAVPVMHWIGKKLQAILL